MSDVLELFGRHAHDASISGWKDIISTQECPYSGKRCFKVRKSEPEISIGTCSVLYGKEKSPLMICPNRLLESTKVFLDAIHLFGHHEPGNEIHVVPEVSVPGGNIDYMLASRAQSDVVDFIGIEFQTLDTTGTVWPLRQKFLKDKGVISDEEYAGIKKKAFGMNWKMTAKTILMQLHHKLETYQSVNRRLVLVVQDKYMDYMRKDFDFSPLKTPARLGDSLHIHTYKFTRQDSRMTISMDSRYSTDNVGLAQAIGLKAEAKIDLIDMFKAIEARISDRTLLRISSDR